MCWAPEIIMGAQSRQQLRFQALLAERAQFMRHNGTDTERSLWRELSGSKLGVAFRRQVPVGRYIADFMAPSLKLIIEVDGGYHRQRVVADARRTRVLDRLGYRVLRLDAELVSRQLPLAVAAVREALQALSSQGAP